MDLSAGSFAVLLTEARAPGDDHQQSSCQCQQASHRLGHGAVLAGLTLRPAEGEWSYQYASSPCNAKASRMYKAFNHVAAGAQILLSTSMFLIRT